MIESFFDGCRGRVRRGILPFGHRSLASLVLLTLAHCCQDSIWHSSMPLLLWQSVACGIWIAVCEQTSKASFQ